MSEPNPAPVATGREALAGLTESTAVAVLAVPGVVRLEPTLRYALDQIRSAGPAALSGARGRTYAAAKGIQLVRRGAVVDLHVDLGLGPGRSALEVAEEVETAVRDQLAAAGLLPGEITVTVLSVER